MFGRTKTEIRNIFFAGLIVTLPVAFSIFIFRFLFVTVDAAIGPAVTRLLIATGVPIQPDILIPGLGIVATGLIVFFVGLFTRNMVGRKLVALGEAVLVKIPVFKNIYVGAKQVIETFGASSSQAFRKVVLIEYPRSGLYALAFITGPSKGEVPHKLGGELVNVFLPTTPNPTSGFFLFVPVADVTELDMTVEEGIKMIISAGLVTPKDPNELPKEIGTEEEST